jgi:hypothetical protein
MIAWELLIFFFNREITQLCRFLFPLLIPLQPIVRIVSPFCRIFPPLFSRRLLFVYTQSRFHFFYPFDSIYEYLYLFPAAIATRNFTRFFFIQPSCRSDPERLAEAQVSIGKSLRCRGCRPWQQCLRIRYR